MITFSDSGNWDNRGIFETSTFPLKVEITLLSVDGLWVNWLREALSGIEAETEVSLLRVIWICELLTGVGAGTDVSLLGICLWANESVIGTAGIKEITNKQKNTLIGNFLNGWSLFRIFRIYTHPIYPLSIHRTFTKVYLKFKFEWKRILISSYFFEVT